MQHAERSPENNSQISSSILATTAMTPNNHWHESDLRLIAFYLTQFHPIPENDHWWGKGFTEWTNVTKAQPLFQGHYQPHLPADFGFYDLRVKETRIDQIKVAKEYGIDGFCYHYYWFSGKRILNRPLDEMFEDTDSDMPFCLCWANENWSRRWDAAEHEVLLAQKYLPDDDLNFIKSLVPYLQDSRYIHVDGRPLIIVYRPQHLPNASKSAQIWRDYCREIGIGEIHLCSALTHGNSDYKEFCFDSGVEFPPHNVAPRRANDQLQFQSASQSFVCEFEDVATSYLNRIYEGSVFKTVFPSWDNTSRRKDRAFVVLNGTPDNYEYWLSATLAQARQRNNLSTQIVFINAWNEWAEGCHLEPDQRFGLRYLEATKRARAGKCLFTSFPDVGHPDRITGSPASLFSDLGSVVQVHASRRLHKLRQYLLTRPKLYAHVRTLSKILGGLPSIVETK